MYCELHWRVVYIRQENVSMGYMPPQDQPQNFIKVINITNGKNHYSVIYVLYQKSDILGNTHGLVSFNYNRTDFTWVNCAVYCWYKKPNILPNKHGLVSFIFTVISLSVTEHVNAKLFVHEISKSLAE